MNSCLFFAFKIFLFINTHKLPLINVRNFNFACFMAKFIIIFIFLWVFFFLKISLVLLALLMLLRKKTLEVRFVLFVFFFFYIFFWKFCNALQSCTHALEREPRLV